MFSHTFQEGLVLDSSPPENALLNLVALLDQMLSHCILVQSLKLFDMFVTAFLLSHVSGKKLVVHDLASALVAFAQLGTSAPVTWVCRQQVPSQPSSVFLLVYRCPS